jgi:hypothetical protein
MKYVFAAETLLCSGVAIFAAYQGEHLISYAATVLMLFCLWAVDRYRRDS